jgi:Mrp family chromosome partitioning ATPase
VGDATEAKTIGVTSCAPRAGVSTVAANLALAAAQAIVRPVLLLDLSSTRPVLAERLNVSGDLGLRAALAGDVRPGECVKASPTANLFLLGANEAGAPQQLSLDGGRIYQLLQALEPDFRFIVVDLPPADSALCFAVAGALSGVLLVMEAQRTRYEAAVRAKQRLRYANASMLGVILNEQSDGLPSWLD